ncbi:MAG TPA: response regulator [Desulfobacterales bacterium]
MSAKESDWEYRCRALEKELQQACREADYYRRIAADTGKRRLRDVNQLAKMVVALEGEQEDRQIAEQRLRESEQRYRSLVENINVGILVVQDQKIVYANPSVPQFLGIATGRIRLDENPFRYIHPEDREAVLHRHLKRLREEKVPELYSFRVLDANGLVKWVEASGTRIEWMGRPATLNFFMDVTDRIRFEEERRILEAQLIRAQKMEAIGTLAGGIAHDFNNLMMAIQGNISLMLCDIETSHPHYEYLRNIEKQIVSGTRLTGQLLGYARKGQYHVKTFDPKTLVEEVAGAFGRTRKNIRIHQNLAKETYLLHADIGQIEQVLWNLFVNASDAMPEGGDLFLETRNVSHREMTGRLYRPVPGIYVELTVRDTGVGMDAETLERVFDPFFTTKPLGRGTGLGLASVFGIVKGHGGYIDVESRVGNGTHFRLYFPATEGEIAPEAGNETKIVTGQGVILLVEDEDTVLAVGAAMLRKLGYRVLEARDGQSAIHVFQRSCQEIDLVILDMIMPGMSGGEVYRRLKQIQPAAKVLISSGVDISGEVAELLQNGCDGFIQKPYRMESLSKKVRQVLGGT